MSASKDPQLNAKSPRPSVSEALAHLRELTAIDENERKLLEYLRKEAPEIYKKLSVLNK